MLWYSGLILVTVRLFCVLYYYKCIVVAFLLLVKLSCAGVLSCVILHSSWQHVILHIIRLLVVDRGKFCHFNILMS